MFSWVNAFELNCDIQKISVEENMAALLHRIHTDGNKATRQRIEGVSIQ